MEQVFLPGTYPFRLKWMDGTDFIRILQKQCMHQKLQFNSFYSWIMHNLLLLRIFYIQTHNFQPVKNI